MKRSLILSVLLATCLAGCGDPKLDGASEQSMAESAKKITEKLDDSKKSQFQEALQVVAFSKMDLGAVMRGEQNAEAVTWSMLSELNGKTADEVIAKAALIKAERAAREKAQALEEIAEIQAELDKAEKDKVELAKFEVLRSRFYQRDKEYSYRKEPIIELSLKNGTSFPVSRAYFKGTIATPGRSVPWLVEDFNYSIPGGLESGEAQELVLSPNQFSDWGKVDAPEDAVFTVEVVRLDGPDSKAVLNASGLSEHKLNRLTKLKAEYQ